MREFVPLEDSDTIMRRIYAKIGGINNVFRLHQIEQFIDNINR